MTYNETVAWLYARTPQFERIGASAYKPGLQTIEALAAALGNPERQYRIIHVAGTNGKGSTSHTLAAILQKAGYKTGLYTSPHLVDFRERMRVDGQMIPQAEVIDFVNRYRTMQLGVEPSFFELTTAMAFNWFATENVDIAVIEVGLGGRLESTNIINPELDIITNISMDHCEQLGNTLRDITFEKCGIMRPGVTTICGEPSAEIREYFKAEAGLHHSPIEFAAETMAQAMFEHDDATGTLKITGTPFGELHFQLTADYQRENARTIMAAVLQLRRQGFELPDEAVKAGFAHVCDLTGLNGRWMRIAGNPLTVCDTGHNIGGWQWLAGQLQRMPRPLTIVLGFANDKDLTGIFPLLPTDATYIATQAAIPRAKKAAILADELKHTGLHCSAETSVDAAYRKARETTPPEGSVFVGGSTYVVADLLKSLQ